MKKNLTILGGGNLGTAIAKGMVKAGLSAMYNITVSRRNAALLEPLKALDINVTSDNVQAVEQSGIIVLAVQPKQLELLMADIKPALNPEKHLIVSVITGVTIRELRETIGKDFTIIRAMPNTAIAINQSMTCIASENANAEAQEVVKNIFDALGKTLIIDERLMEAATVLGACGIAFFLRFIRAASQGGIEVGFHAEEAQLIAAQTAMGASGLLLNSGDHPEQAIDRVTTPQGCTIAGLNEMEHHGLSSALIKGIITSFKKIEKIK